MTAQLVILAYGLFLLVGAAMGRKVGSRISFILGLASSICVFWGLYVASISPANGYMYLSLIGAVLSILFATRYIKTRKMMPSGMLLAVTFLFLIFCLNQLSVL